MGTGRTGIPDRRHSTGEPETRTNESEQVRLSHHKPDWQDHRKWEVLSPTLHVKVEGKGPLTWQMVGLPMGRALSWGYSPSTLWN